MPPSKTLSQLARWALIGAALLMGVALLTTVWSTHRGVQSASETLVRGQASAVMSSVRARLNRSDEMPAPAELGALLADHAADGLLYLAVLDPHGRILADAGVAGEDRARLDRWLTEAQHVAPVMVAGRARSVFQPRWRRRGLSPPDPPVQEVPPPFLIELEPRIAAALTADARRALGIGALAAGAFLVLALALVRWFLRREQLARALEHERRLASLGEMSAVLAHEIRNPLASLKGNAQILARALPDGERTRAKAELVVSEAVRLEGLTNDLLEFARVGAIHRVEVDPAALLREAAGAFDGAAIRVEADGAPARWPLDRDRIGQVLGNLLDNAVQADGEAVIARVSEAGGQLVYTVRDRGPGIAAEDLERIFEPFHTKRTRGTGLGLAVARRLVELHGGRITAANAEGGGALFRVSIPRK